MSGVNEWVGGLTRYTLSQKVSRDKGNFQGGGGGGKGGKGERGRGREKGWGK